MGIENKNSQSQHYLCILVYCLVDKQHFVVGQTGRVQEEVTYRLKTALETRERYSLVILNNFLSIK